MNIEAHPVKLNVTNGRQIVQTAKEVLTRAGRVDILVDNAGHWPKGSILDTDDDLWQGTVSLNLTSVFRVSRAFLPSMVKNGYGRIINLGSIAGEVGLPGYCAYSAAKAGVIMLTRTMAMELASCGITVNSVAPGAIRTDLNRKVLEDPAYEEMVLRNIPAKFIAEPNDIAGVVLFLTTEDARYVNGAGITVDGGLSLN